MMVSQGQQARELQPMAPHPSLPAQPPAAHPPLESETEHDQRIRWRVVCISVILAVYLIMQTCLQYVFDMAAMQDALEKVREVTHMRGGSHATALVLNSLPSVLMSIAIGLLVPLCGYLGVKQNQKWLVGCFCGCNAFQCCTGIISMVMLLVLTMTVKAVTPQVELFLEKCDPMQCQPLQNTTGQDHFIDCLASGEWKEYRPRFSGPRLSSECPPIFLTCDNQPNYKLRGYGHEGIDGLYEKPAEGGFPVRTLPKQVQPRGTFDDADAPVRAAGMGDLGAFLSSEVPTSTRFASSSHLRGPHQSLRRLLDRRLRFSFGHAHHKGDLFQPRHGQKFVPPPMPKDPITECQVTETVEHFHQIRLLAPELLPQLELFMLVRVFLLLPVVVLGCLGFCWGKDLFDNLNAGYNPVSRSQEARPQVMLNPALGMTTAGPTTSTQMQMAQPLMLSAPPVPPPQVTAIASP